METSERDILARAMLVIKQHGGGAATYALSRADELFQQRAFTGAATWLKILAEIERLQPPSEEDLWLSVVQQFAEHVHNDWGDRTLQDALNRIAKKVLAAHGLDLSIRLGPDTCTIELVERSRGEIEAAVKFHDSKHPGSRPPTLLRFAGREFIVDGHNRINQFLADGTGESLTVILLTPS